MAFTGWHGSNLPVLQLDPSGWRDRSPGKPEPFRRLRVLSPRAVRCSWPSVSQEGRLNPGLCQGCSQPFGSSQEAGRALCGSLSRAALPFPGWKELETSKAHQYPCCFPTPIRGQAGLDKALKSLPPHFVLSINTGKLVLISPL